MKRIVIADDSSTARMFIRRCLEIAGCREATILEAANGQEALALLHSESVDLVVTDLNMPEMDGVDLLKRIKCSPRLTAIPVVVISSAANAEKIRELQDMGASAVLSKPISPAAIAPTIAALLPADGIKEG